MKIAKIKTKKFLCNKNYVAASVRYFLHFLLQVEEANFRNNQLGANFLLFLFLPCHVHNIGEGEGNKRKLIAVVPLKIYRDLGKERSSLPKSL